MKPTDFLCNECMYHYFDVVGKSRCSYPGRDNPEVWEYCPSCYRFKKKEQ